VNDWSQQTFCESVDEMQIAPTRATGANRKLARNVSFASRSESRCHLMANMNPLGLGLPAQRVGYSVESVSDNAVDSLDACGGESIGKLVCYLTAHDLDSFSRQTLGLRGRADAAVWQGLRCQCTRSQYPDARPRQRAHDYDLFSSPEKRWPANPNDTHQPTTEGKYQFQLKNLALLPCKLCVPQRQAFSGASFDSRENLRVPSFALGAPEDKIVQRGVAALADRSSKKPIFPASRLILIAGTRTRSASATATDIVL
jgi:hypothetical protein